MRLKKDNLKALLERNPESKRQFAKRAGVNVQSLYYWIDGKRNPKLVFVNKLAKALGCDIEDIAEFEFPKKNLPAKRVAIKNISTYSIRLDSALRNALEKWCFRNEMMVSEAIRMAVRRMLSDKDFKID